MRPLQLFWFTLHSRDNEKVRSMPLRSRVLWQDKLSTPKHRYRGLSCGHWRMGNAELLNTVTFQKRVSFMRKNYLLWRHKHVLSAYTVFRKSSTLIKCWPRMLQTETLAEVNPLAPAPSGRPQGVRAAWCLCSFSTHPRLIFLEERISWRKLVNIYEGVAN